MPKECNAPPTPPTMLQLLEGMAGCVVLTNVNKGNMYGNNKHKKERKETFGKKKVGKRGRGIKVGNCY